MENSKEIIIGDYQIIKEYLDISILEAINPKYPRWEKWCIKRKYGKHEAIYIDRWITKNKSLMEFIPKVKPFIPQYKISDIT